MTRFVGATEAARLLGVQKATLYAYVSRGLIARRVAVDGRTSLYDADDLDALAERVRRRETQPRPSLDVQIVTAVTTLDESGPRYRGHDVAELARTATFERVAELLWTGALPAGAAWPDPLPADVRRARGVTRAVGGRGGLPALAAVSGALGVHHPGDDPPAAARRLLGVVPAVLGAGDGGRPGAGLGERLAEVWRPDAVAAFGPALDRALILLADHELATSTLAVRVAGSTWTGPYPAFAAGLATVQGVLHGGTSHEVYEFFVECEQVGAAAAVTRRLQARQRLPGFGHMIYTGDDPRLAPMLEAVGDLPDPHGRGEIVDDVLAEVGVRFTRRPNVDFGLGALAFVGGLPGDVPLFAIARIAGFAAHLLEELQERPLRYRGLARPPRP